MKPLTELTALEQVVVKHILDEVYFGASNYNIIEDFEPMKLYYADISLYGNYVQVLKNILDV